MESYIPEKTTPYRPNIFSSPVCILSYFSMIPTICRLVLCFRVKIRVRVRLMLLDPNSLRHPGYWHSKFHSKLFSLFPKQHTTSLHIVVIMEKYDHIQTGLEKIFGLYGVVFLGIYDSIQIRYRIGLYGVVLYSVGLYGGGGGILGIPLYRDSPVVKKPN